MENIQQLYFKETGHRAVHIGYNDNDEWSSGYVYWLEEKVAAQEKAREISLCEHLDNIGNCCKTIGHKPCTCPVTKNALQPQLTTGSTSTVRGCKHEFVKRDYIGQPNGRCISCGQIVP